MSENKVTVVLDKPIAVAHSNMSSVDIKRNAKGIVEFVVKAYADDIKAASAHAQTVFDQLSEKY
jgi:hypothetical protein